MRASTPPALSAIAITPSTFDRLQRTIAALRSQTLCDQIELVLVAPEKHGPLPDEDAFAGFHSHRVVLLNRAELTSVEAWAAGIRAAQAPVVVLCEDHSYPESDWAAHLLEAHRQPWAAVGPAVRNGNPDRLFSWAEFFIDFGEWAYPSTSGSRSHLPGHNSSYKRDLLLAYGDDLSRKLEVETLLQWELVGQGHQLYLQADAVTKHIQFTSFRRTLALHFWQGWCFSGQRADSWSRRRRLFWFFGSPLIPLVRLRRVYRESRKPGRFDRSLPGLVAILCLILLIDGIGQMAGIAFGPGDVYRRLSHYESSMGMRANMPAV